MAHFMITTVKNYDQDKVILAIITHKVILLHKP